MKIAVVSGKGGTGKTTVATSLAKAWSVARPVVVADCDVEGPNAHHFLEPLDDVATEIVTVLVPRIDAARCTSCDACAEFCRFHALSTLPSGVLVFDELCHSCGGCVMVCPEGAVREEPLPIGTLRVGRSDGLRFVQGALEVGRPRAVPVIAAAAERAMNLAGDAADLILDGPPGASCNVAEVVGFADVCLLVTEPTPFGLHDLGKALALVDARDTPCAVVVNRSGGKEIDAPVEAWCAERALPILLRVPDDRAVAEGYARGRALVDTRTELREALRSMRSELATIAAPGSEEARA